MQHVKPDTSRLAAVTRVRPCTAPKGMFVVEKPVTDDIQNGPWEPMFFGTKEECDRYTVAYHHNVTPDQARRIIQ
jgi:hypothetical protein